MPAFAASCSTGAKGISLARLLAAGCGILASSALEQSGPNDTVIVEEACALHKVPVVLMQNSLRQASALGPGFAAGEGPDRAPLEPLRLLEVDLEVPMPQLESTPTGACKWVLALIEVLALGFCGVDRCYMGQPCLGVVKGCTLGGIGVWFLLDYAAVVINGLSRAVEIDLLGFRSAFDSKDIHASFALAVVSVSLAPGITVLVVLGVIKVARPLLPIGKAPPPSQADATHGEVPEASLSSSSLAAVSRDGSELIRNTDDEKMDETTARLSEYGGPVSIRKLFSLASPSEMALFALGTLSAAAYAVSQPYLIFLFGEMLTATSAEVNSDSYSRKVLQVSVTTFVTGAAVILVGTLQGFCFGYFVDRQVAKFRPLYFRALLYRDISWFDTHDVGALPYGMDEDLEAYRVGLGTKLSTALMVTVKVLCALVLAFILSWKVTLIMLVTFPILMLAIMQMVQSSVEVTQDRQGAYHRASRLADEVLFAIRTVVSFGGERHEIKRYDESAEEARRGGIMQRTKHGMGKGCFLSAYILSYALGFYCCMRFALNGDDLSVDKVVTALFCIVSAGYTAGQAPSGYIAFQEARVSMARFFYIIEHEGEIQKHLHDAGKPCAPIDTLELRDVHFSYPARADVEVLRGMSLIIRKGQKVAVVGESGSGKSSAMALLARFYDPGNGAVLVNGADLRSFSVASYRSQIGYVGQEPVLFATSIRSNILQGSPEATSNDVQRAARLANLDFVDTLPEKFDTFVGSGGSQFSGGQKQRMAIARALIKKPSLLLLDEATSALDSTSERLVQEAIDNIGSSSGLGVTIVSIAHRLSTVKNSDVIYVIKEGQVVEQGTHGELMAKVQGVYHALAVAQAMAREEHSTASISTEASSLAGRVDDFSALDLIEGAPASREEEARRREEEIIRSYQVPMTRLLAFCRPEWWAAVPGLLCAAASGSIYPIMGTYPWVQAVSAFVHYSQGVSTAQFRHEVEHACLFFTVLGVIQLFVCSGQFACFGFLGEAITKRCRVAMLTSILRQEVGFHDNPENTPARLTASLRLCAHRVAAFCIQLGDQVDAVAAGVVGVVLAMVFQWQMALGSLVAIPIFGIALAMEVAVNFRGSSTENEYLKRAAGVVSDSFNGARTVHAAGGEEAVVELYKRLISIGEKDMCKNNLLLGVAYGLAVSALYWILGLGFLLMGHLIRKDYGSFEDCCSAFFGITYAGMSAASAFFLATDMAKAKVAACEIFSLLDRESTIDSLQAKGQTLNVADEIGQMQFTNVRFCYPWRPDVLVLKELSFTIQAGQSVGLVGPSGGGKSTVLSLIQRFYDPEAGEILIGKARTPLAKINVQWWRRQVGYVGQEPILFNGTILDNVKYGLESGESLPEDRLEELKRMAHMSFIHKQMQGWDTQVGQRGTRLSGGQKQRVAIARAIVRDPSILLFDEATSSLDSASEKIVAQALNDVSQGRTSLLIAHRLSTVQHCDVILVLEDGRLLESGNHEELVKLGGAYAKFRMQSPAAAS